MSPSMISPVDGVAELVIPTYRRLQRKMLKEHVHVGRCRVQARSNEVGRHYAADAVRIYPCIGAPSLQKHLRMPKTMCKPHIPRISGQ